MVGFKKGLFILRSVLIGYLFMIIMLALYAIILAYTDIPESTMPVCILAIGVISVFFASLLAVLKLKKDGLKNGGLIGLLFVLVLYIISSLETGYALNSYAITTLFFYMIFGMLRRNNWCEFYST